MSVAHDPNDDVDATQLLYQLRDGDASAEDALLGLVYGELRALARHLMQGERADHTLQATALVNEAWMRLMGSENLATPESRGHFMRLAARAMRRVLVDHARAGKRDKRGGGATRITLDERWSDGQDESVEILELEEALERLEAKDPALARVVELRFFAGLTLVEASAALGTTQESIRWSWKLARAFLLRELEKGEERE